MNMNAVPDMLFFEQKVRRAFSRNNGHAHYLDSAATTLKPDTVLDAVVRGYEKFAAPVHRASYGAAEQASLTYEESRETVAAFIGAKPEQLVFTASCTAAINGIVVGWGERNICKGQTVWVTRMEHNANYLPWRMLCERVGARLKIIELNDNGQLLFDSEDIWNDSTALIAVSHCSNVLGGENPVQRICQRAREQGIVTIVDAAQSVAHKSISVADTGCDFLAFSAHKMYGPEGIGALYIHPDRIAQMQPFLYGGGIVTSLSPAAIRWQQAPHCFEAGSANLSGALGFAAAVNFITDLGIDDIGHHIGKLGSRCRKALNQIKGLTLLPTAGASHGTSVVSFTLDGVHPHDVAHIAAEQGVAIRTGHNCSHLLMQGLGLTAVNRASFGVYSNLEDVDALVQSVQRASEIFK
ncbi:aminotransferase class V-fold PLP-dependent enzyme [Porticoccus sp. GXU_MW_L64]